MESRNDYTIRDNGIGPWKSLLIGLLLFLGCFLMSGIISALVIIVFSEDLLTSEGGRQVYRLVLGFNNLTSWALPVIIWSRITGSSLNLNKNASITFYLLVPAIIFFVIPLVQALILPKDFFLSNESLKVLGEWMVDREKEVQDSLLKLLGDKTGLALFVNLLAFAAIPAFAEELFFRSFLLKALQKVTGLHLAVWISAFIFSLIHFQFFGFFSRMLLGLILGYLFVYSSDIKVSIFAHFFHNAFSIIIAFFAANEYVGKEYLEDDFGFGTMIVICSTGIASLLMYLFISKGQKTLKTEE